MANAVLYADGETCKSLVRGRLSQYRSKATCTYGCKANDSGISYVAPLLDGASVSDMGTLIGGEMPYKKR